MPPKSKPKVAMVYDELPPPKRELEKFIRYYWVLSCCVRRRLQVPRMPNVQQVITELTYITEHKETSWALRVAVKHLLEDIIKGTENNVA